MPKPPQFPAPRRRPTPGRLAFSLLPFLSLALCARGAPAQSAGGVSYIGLATGALRLHSVDEAASPLRYAGTARPVELTAAWAPGSSLWDVSLAARTAGLHTSAVQPGTERFYRLGLAAGWARALTRVAGVRLAAGVAADAAATARSHHYVETTRGFLDAVVQLGPRLRLERASAADRVTADLAAPLVALVLRSYGPAPLSPWGVEAAGGQLRGGRLALDWWHGRAAPWRVLVGYRAELLRVGPDLILAENAQGVVVGLSYTRHGRHR